jgi:hypothetical protein
MKNIPATFVLFSCLAGQALGQTNVTATSTNAPAPQPAPPKAEEKAHWAFGVSAYTYILPDERTYVQPTLTADRDRLHLEARYNYEALETASIWAGYKFSGGDKLGWEITPMLGGVFGKTSGIAPGYKGSLTWWRFDLYSEGEYLASTGDSSDSFFYNWSEFTIAPVDWLRVGIVAQRTHAYQTDREIQRGLMGVITLKKVDISAYVFNPDEYKATVVAAVSFHL